jgi:hypothetical protein
MRDRPGQATVAAAIAVLAVALIAAALAWSQPKRGIGGRAPLGIAAEGALRIADSRGEAAILRAPALAPGTAVTGTVRIDSRGLGGQLVLSRPRLLEMSQAPEGDLATALRLRIHDLTGREPVYAGPLAAMPTLRLGSLPAGESRRYRFVAKLPELGLVDNGLMGARVRFDYRWRLREQ